MINYTFNRGDKVIHAGVVFDFGYYSETEGKCIIYNEGECNMQDSYAVNISDLKLAPSPPKTCTCCPIHGIRGSSK